MKGSSLLASTGVFLLSLFALAPSQARADLLNFSFTDSGPIIQANNGTLTYSVRSGVLHADVVPFSISGDIIPNGFAFFSDTVNASQSVDLRVDQAGHFVSNGSGLQVTGAIDLDGDSIDDVSGLLLSGAITDFGAEAAEPPTWTANGLFKVTGGLLTGPVSLSGGGTMPAGFDVDELAGFFLFAEDVTSGTLGDFTHDFSSDSVKKEEGAITPEPSAFLLMIVGSAALAGWRFRNSQKPST